LPRRCLIYPQEEYIALRYGSRAATESGTDRRQWTMKTPRIRVAFFVLPGMKA
jgi:hypothetical protein